MNRVAKSGTRTAFTLIELVVVVSIIGLLIALVLPAVQSAREASRRIVCANRLKQLGIALSSYESALNAFPQGTHYSPHVMLLPYLDMTNVFNAINFQIASYSDPSYANTTVSESSLAAFLCPSDIRHSDRSWNNYSGTTGVCERNHQLVGIFSPKKCDYSHITDGTGTTAAFSEILTGEKRTADHRRVVFATPSFFAKAGDFDLFVGECLARTLANSKNENVDVNDYRGEGWIGSSHTSTLYNHCLGINNNTCSNAGNIPTGAWTAGSAHDHGGNTAFADGHVVFLHDSMSLAVWRAYGSRGGGESVPSADE